MNDQKPEADFELEGLINAVLAAKHATNAAAAALQVYLKKQRGGGSGEPSVRPVRPTFMSKARNMVHESKTGDEDVATEEQSGGDDKPDSGGSNPGGNGGGYQG
jgi:hypothetical protein